MGSPSFFMTQQTNTTLRESVIFRFIRNELTVSFPTIHHNAIGIQYVRPIPPIEYVRNGDWYYCGDNYAFYRYAKYSDLWVRQRVERVPPTIRAWCLATNKPINDDF